jgi:nitrogen fixation protein FixH
VRADSGFVDHLVETLAFFRELEPAPPSGPKTLERLGLSPGRFELVHRTRDGAENRWTIGNAAAATESKVFALRDGRPVIAQGALVAMLDHLRSFRVLRHSRIVTWASDDVDEWRIKSVRGKKPTSERYTQRHYPGWADRKEHPLTPRASETVTRTLDQLTHLRAEGFVESKAELDKVLSLRPSDELAIEFTGRKDEKLGLKLRKVDGAWWAEADNRTGILFRLYPGTEKTVAALRALPVQ